MKLDYCYQGDCRDSMRQLLAMGGGGKVQTIVTSPPYFGLRDYGCDGQLGLEPTLQEFIANMVEVFDLCRDLLATDGTLWLNMGDSYAANHGSGSVSPGNKQSTSAGSLIDLIRLPKRSGLKQKDLMGVPWRLAFALQDAGWYLRQDIIWHKPNPMPESVRDRCTKSHEYLFLLSKSERYYFDQEAILEPCSPNTHARLAQNVQDHIGSTRANGGAKTNGNMKAVARKSWNGSQFHKGKTAEHQLGRASTNRKHDPASGNKNNASFDEAMAIMPEKRNKRSVWTIATESYSEAHFATFPRALVEPCILAGSKAGDIVFDPFMGSGTTAQVAQALGRKWIGCELNPQYIALQADRTRQQGLELVA